MVKAIKTRATPFLSCPQQREVIQNAGAHHLSVISNFSLYIREIVNSFFFLLLFRFKSAIQLVIYQRCTTEPDPNFKNRIIRLLLRIRIGIVIFCFFRIRIRIQFWMITNFKVAACWFIVGQFFPFLAFAPLIATFEYVSLHWVAYINKLPLLGVEYRIRSRILFPEFFKIRSRNRILTPRIRIGIEIFKLWTSQSYMSIS